jgi:hypothetical protein
LVRGGRLTVNVSLMPVRINLTQLGIKTRAPCRRTVTQNWSRFGPRQLAIGLSSGALLAFALTRGVAAAVELTPDESEIWTKLAP